MTCETPQICWAFVILGDARSGLVDMLRQL